MYVLTQVKSNDEAVILCLTTKGTIKLKQKDMEGTKVRKSMVDDRCLPLNWFALLRGMCGNVCGCISGNSASCGDVT